MSFIKQLFSVAVVATAAYFTGGATLAYQTAAVFATSMVVSRIFGQKMPKGQDNGVRQQVPPATVNSLPIVYGDAYLGGVYVDAALSQDQKVMYHVFAISSISQNGQFSYDQTKFYYGDRLITFDATDRTKVVSLTDGNGNVDTKINGKLYINLYISNNAGTITSTNGASAPSVVMGYNSLDKKTVPSNVAWASSGRQMYNTAFAIVKLIYSADAGTTNLSPITFYARQYLNSQGVAKPGDVWYDYLTNTEYGGAVDSSLVDSASATALNNYSDQLITYTPSGGGSATQPRYRINGVLDTGTNVLDNIDKLLECCDSWMAYNAAQGQWSIVINKAESASLAFNDDNIIGEIKVSAMDINQSINQIEAKFPNSSNKDIPDYVFIQTPSGLLYPNEPVNKYTTEFTLTNNSVQAQYLANRILEQAREDLIVTITTTYEGIQANAGDVVSVTNSVYGWNAKLFRVMKVNEASMPDGSLGATLTLNEYNAQVYDDKSITSYTPAGNSNLSNIAYFGTLTAPTITDQLPNAAVPTFSVACVIPPDGQITRVTLYYTNVASPTDDDWKLWGFQTTPTSVPYTNGSTLKFVHINLPTDTYYFAFKVNNEIGESNLSNVSSSYNWLPNPSSSAVAGTFIAQFAPGSLAVPYASGTPTFTGVTPQLYGTTTGGSVDFVSAQDDTDASFVNNTWRIGGSSTTGYGDIVASGITIGNPTDGGFYALWSAPTAMSTNPATLTVPVRYKATDGTVYQGANAVQQFVYAIQGDQGNPGVSGNQHGTAYLYQWSTSIPSDPNGYSTFVWETVENTNYTGGNSWTTTIPSNPGTPSLKLWQASIGVTDLATATTTEVDWSTGFAINDVTQNGIAGAQTGYAIVYQWAVSIPSAPSGTTTYTWATGEVAAVPSGWTATPTNAPSVGYTLWQARVYLVAAADETTSTVNWSSSSISAVGYSGSAGASARLMYARIANNPNATAGTVTVSGDNRPTGSQSSAVWGASFNVTWYASDPNPSSNDSLYQSDGIYDQVNNQTVWSAPYISALKVGALSAITVNTGGLTVSDYIKAGSNPAVSGSTMSGYGSVFNSGGTFAIGNSSRNLSFNGSTLTMNGDLVVTGNIQADAITKKWVGQLENPTSLFSTASNPYITSLPSFTVSNDGKLVVICTVVFYNQSTSTNYKCQTLMTINNEGTIVEYPILYLNQTATNANFIPSGPNLTTGGSFQTYTQEQETTVTAGTTINIEFTTFTGANNTSLFLVDAYYVAMLFQR